MLVIAGLEAVECSKFQKSAANYCNVNSNCLLNRFVSILHETEEA